MDAGRLRHYIQVKRPTTTRNALGEPVQTFASVGGFQAEIKPTSARERLMNNSITTEVTHVITMRYAPDVSEDCRIAFGDRTFEIVGIVNVEERNVELQILAAEQRKGAA